MTTTAKKIGYHVYHAPDGSGESYLGFATSLRAARRLAATGRELPESLYATARAAGHCAGLQAPDTSHEASEPTAWFGRGGYYCAVAVYSEGRASPALPVGD